MPAEGPFRRMALCGSFQSVRFRVWMRWTQTFRSRRELAERTRDAFLSAHRKRIRHGSFRSLVDLQSAIYRYVADHNADPKPFIWTAPSTAILTKLRAYPPSQCSRVGRSGLPQHLAHRLDKAWDAIVVARKVGDEICALG
jgi:hypothetical protein